MNLKFVTRVNEYTKVHYTAKATIMDKLPKVGDTLNGSVITAIKEATVDTENDDKVFEYDIYKVDTIFKYDEEDTVEDIEYIAVKKGKF